MELTEEEREGVCGLGYAVAGGQRNYAGDSGLGQTPVLLVSPGLCVCVFPYLIQSIKL